jgi:hypothetical protein
LGDILKKVPDANLRKRIETLVKESGIDFANKQRLSLLYSNDLRFGGGKIPFVLDDSDPTLSEKKR